MRLFLALPLPAELKEEIRHCTKLIERDCFQPGQQHLLKWVPAEQLHITQYFLGKVEETDLANITEKLTETINSYPSFHLNTNEICWAPEDSKHPKMIWLKFNHNYTFAIISNSIYNAIAPMLPSPEKPREEIIPHITLIRLKQVKPFERKLNQVKNHSLPVKEVELWQSFLDSKGAKYQKIGAFALKGS